ncbi:MAG: hypothetical protein ACRBN8_28980 [Nannocystales bacterium]
MAEVRALWAHGGVGRSVGFSGVVVTWVVTVLYGVWRPMDRRPQAVELPAEQLHQLTDEEALALADKLLDSATEQKSGLLRYRFSSSFQADWKAELGHVLNTADRLGFLDALWERVYSRLHGAGERPADVDANDTRHHMLRADFAPAVVAHCLTQTGWSFEAWEPRRPRCAGSAVDVDVSLWAPDGTAVDVQVKAPDQPGRRAKFRRVDGERDEAVIASLNHGARQLGQGGSRAKMLVVCPQRDWPMSRDPMALISHVIGGATQLPGPRFELGRERLGVFRSSWRHIAAVVLLDFVRHEEASYTAVTLLNPWASVAASPDWFAFGRVCTIEGGVVCWRGGAPMSGGLPEGTVLTGSAGPDGELESSG